MKFTTLQEYFYKLRNALFILILIPLLVFIYILSYSPPKPEWLDTSKLVIMISLTSLVALEWLMASILFYKMVFKLRSEVSLGIKLEKYYTITIIRFALCASASLVATLGYFLTEDSIFSALFAIGLVLFFSLWPRSGKVCRDLKLKGDERLMVLHKRTTL